MKKLNIETLSVEEFSNLLGVQKNSVYKWNSKNELPEKIFRKIGSKLIFIASEVESWILEDRCQLVRVEKAKPAKHSSITNVAKPQKVSQND